MRKRNSSRLENRYPSYQLQFETYKEWAQYLERFPWQWHATLTLEPDIKFFPARELFNKWRLRLIDEEKLRVGTYLLSALKKGVLHFHVLMVGRNRGGKNLYSCDVRKWERAWRFFARIRTVSDNARVCDYVALHFLGFKSDHSEVESFDKILLRQVMRPRNDYLENFDGIMNTG